MLPIIAGKFAQMYVEKNKRPNQLVLVVFSRKKPSGPLHCVSTTWLWRQVHHLLHIWTGWRKLSERTNGVRRKVNMLNFLNFFFSSIKYPLLFQNISSFFSNFRIKVQSRGRAFLEQFVLVFFISCDCQFFPRLAVSPFWASTVIAAGHSSTTQNMWE